VLKFLKCYFKSFVVELLKSMFVIELRELDQDALIPPHRYIC